MFHSILVPLDSSPVGEQALPFALSIARRAEAPVRVAQVHTSFVYAESGLIYDDQLDRTIREQEAQYLREVTKRLEAAAPVRVTWALREGAVADQLLEQAAEVGADLIVMSTHGRGPISRFWLGSVADEVVRRSPCPVLLVRSQEAPADLSAEPVVRNILVPLDGSPLAEQVLERAGALARLLDADVTLLRVVKPLLFPGHDPTELRTLPFGQPAAEKMQREARDYLDGVAEGMRARSLRVQTRVLVHMHPAAAILERALELPRCLIALATHGRSGIRRALLGSVADKVVRGATMPVMIYRPPSK